MENKASFITDETVESARLIRGMAVLQAELDSLPTYLSVLNEQLSGSLQTVESGVVSVIERINALHAVSQHQLDRISALGENDATQIAREGNAEMVNLLSEALGSIQFQDVVRQRVGHVQAAILELGSHFLALREQILLGEDSGQLPLKERLNRHLEQYVMTDQLKAHLHVAGEELAPDGDLPPIELF